MRLFFFLTTLKGFDIMVSKIIIIISYAQSGQKKQRKQRKSPLKTPGKCGPSFGKVQNLGATTLWHMAFSFEVHARKTSRVEQSTNGSGNSIFFEFREKTLE